MSMNQEGAHGGNFVVATATAGAALTGLSGAATTYSTSAIGFAIQGKLYSKALVSGGTTPTTDGNTAATMALTANQAAAFVWALNSSGTVKVYKGPTVAWTDTTASSTAVYFPAVPSDNVVIGYHLVQAGATTSGTWTFGTSNWNATGIVAITVTNAYQLPSAPLMTA